MILIMWLLFIVPLVLFIKTTTLSIFLLLIIMVLFDVILLWYYLAWRDEVCKNTAKISYRTFVSLYDVMPEEFVLRTYDFMYGDNYVDFKTFFDYWQYRRFHKNIEKRQSQQKQIKNQAKLITDLQRGLAREQADIDYFMKACGSFR